MYLLDTNVLLYSVDSESKFHKGVYRWLGRLLQDRSTICFSWIALMGFLRISTNAKIYKTPLTSDKAMQYVATWLSLPAARVLEPGQAYPDLLRRMIVEGQAKGPLIMDAGLAALALEHGAALCTYDRDFSRFPDLIVIEPAKDS